MRATIVVGSLTVKSVHNGAANVVAIFAISVPTLETAIIVEFFTVDIMLQWLIALVVIAMNVNGTTAILALTLIGATIATKLAVAVVKKMQKVVTFYTVFVMIKNFARNA